MGEVVVAMTKLFCGLGGGGDETGWGRGYRPTRGVFAKWAK